MPFYKSIDGGAAEGKRTIEGLLRLIPVLDASVPAKTVDNTLLLATWNIREFGGAKSGGREAEPLFYLAEIISRFDIVAIQEVRDNLDPLDRLMNILGGWWKYVVSDVTLGTQGNSERVAFVFDSRKLSFGGLAGELVPPLKKQGTGLVSDFGFARTPYLAGFRAGWFKFTICSDHFYYGTPKADDPQRVAEAESLVGLLKQRMKSKDRWANNAILLGDFNVFSVQDKTFMALEKGQFQVAASLKGKYTNANLDKPFDQIAFLAPDVARQIDVMKSGVVPFFDLVYRDTDAAIYLPGKPVNDYRQWRTFKMSDHLPVWVQLDVDFGEDYLKRKAAAPAVPAGPGPK